MRRHYLDNIRWGIVLLVLVYHVIYNLSALGISGTHGASRDIRAFDTLLYFVYPWMIPILFVIAGMSARYALEKRSLGRFFQDRFIKLMVPTTLGLFVYQWLIGFFFAKHRGLVGSSIIKNYLWSVLWSAPSHLWFVQMLGAVSLVLVLIRLVDRHDLLWKWGGKANIWVVLFMVLPAWGATQILNVPTMITYRFGYYGLLFLLGYAVFSHDSVQHMLIKFRLPFLFVALLLGVWFTIRYWGADYPSFQTLRSLLTNVYAWTSILAFLSCGQVWLNGTSKFAAHMTKASYGYYILHYVPVYLMSLFLLTYSHLPLLLNYVIVLVVELGVTAGLYELFSRIPVIRFMVLGIWNRAPLPSKPPAKVEVATPAA